MRKLSVILLFSIFCSLAKAKEAAILHGIRLTSDQERELAQLVCYYKNKLEQHCTICYLKPAAGKKHYRQYTEKEWKYAFKKSADGVRPAIKRITDFYKRIGLSPQNIQQELQLLENSLSCWCGDVQ